MGSIPVLGATCIVLARTLGAVASEPVTTLTTSRIASELLEETLLTLDQVSTGVTVLALSATRDPEQSPRARRWLGDLVALIQEAEGDLGTYAPLHP